MRDDFVSSSPSRIEFTICDQERSLNYIITPDKVAEKNEEIIVTLDEVILTHATNGSAVNLSSEETNRLVLSSTNATVTILDDDGKTALHCCRCMHSIVSSIAAVMCMPCYGDQHFSIYLVNEVFFVQCQVYIRQYSI